MPGEQESSFAATLETLYLEDEARTLRLQIAGLKQVISCAVCPICGEQICDQEWTLDDNGEGNLVHVECMRKEEAETKE